MNLNEWIKQNFKWILGALLGLICGILILTIGFFRTLLLAALVIGSAILMGNENARVFVKAGLQHILSKITGRKS